MEEAWRRRHPTAPWINRYGVHVLDELLRPSDNVVEFGSGRSTVWLSRRVAHVVSVETDVGWYKNVAKETNDPTVDLRLASDSTANEYLSCIKHIDSADVAFVDGAYRAHAASWAIDAVSSGGVVVIDDAHWFLPTSLSVPSRVKTTTQGWQTFSERTSSWRTIWTSDGVAATAFFIAP